MKPPWLLRMFHVEPPFIVWTPSLQVCMIVSMDTSSSLSPWYVTGLMEGEGAFTYGRNGSRVALYFGIKLTEANRSILESLREFFGGIGKIYPVRASGYFRVCRIEELRRIVDHFDRYPLRGAKRGSFLVWREMVLLKLASFGDPPWDLLDCLARKLSAASPRGRALERTGR